MSVNVFPSVWDLVYACSQVLSKLLTNFLYLFLLRFVAIMLAVVEIVKPNIADIPIDMGRKARIVASATPPTVMPRDSIQKYKRLDSDIVLSS